MYPFMCSISCCLHRGCSFLQVFDNPLLAAFWEEPLERDTTVAFSGAVHLAKQFLVHTSLNEGLC